LDLTLLRDFADNAVNQIAKFEISMVLSPEEMMKGKYIIPVLNWDSVSYGKEELDKTPNDKQGIYAFVICQNNDVLPPHGYILYIGIAGKNSNRSLRDRYKDYLNQKKIIKHSAKIARMIGT